jgi:uncharacterized membrane protein
MFEFIACLGCAICLILLPLFVPYFVLPETRDSLPNLFGMRYIPPDIPRPVLLLKRGTFFDFLKEHVIVYFPSVVLILIGVPAAAYFDIPVPKICFWTMTPSFVISAFLLYIFKLKGRRRFSTYTDLLFGLPIFNYMVILWMLLLGLLILRAWQHGVAEIIGSKEKVVIELIAVSLVIVVCHALIAWLRPSIRALSGLAVLAVGVLCAYPGPAAIAAVALREARLGGGTRISYTVMGARATTPEPATGCLVLATTSWVVIGGLDDNSCAPLRRFAFTASEVKPRPVRVFSRNEINISGVPRRVDKAATCVFVYPPSCKAKASRHGFLEGLWL